MEPSIVVYARFHGIARSHLAVDPLSFIPRPPADSAVSLDDPDDGSLLTVKGARSTLTQKQREKLDISKTGAIFLSSVLKTPALLKEAELEIRWDDLPDYRRLKRMRMEEPVLKGDHELDMRSFRVQTSLDQMELDLPLEQLDDENDEGLGFPVHYQDFPRQMQDRFAKEKLDCTKEVLIFMQDMRQVLTSSMEEAHGQVYEMINWSSKLEQNHFEPLTPPLLPREPSSVPFMPSASCLELEVCSDTEPRSLPEYVQVDRLLAEDLILDDGSAENHAVGNHAKMILDLQEESLSTPPDSRVFISPKRPLSDDLKVDTPITPPISAKKRCLHVRGKSLNDMLQEASLPSWPEPGSKDAQLLDDKLTEAAESAKHDIDYRLKSERLREVEPSVRIDVPVLPGPQVIAPWSHIPGPLTESNDGVQRLVAELIANCDFNSDFLTESKDERELPWNPFPGGLKRPDVQESIENRAILNEFLVQPGLESGADTYSAFTPDISPADRRDGLEGELMPHDFSNELDAIALNQGYINSLPHNLSYTLAPSSAASKGARTEFEQSTQSAASVTKLRAPRTSNLKSSPMFGSHFSAGRQLTRFMDIRHQKGKEPDIQDSPYFGQLNTLSEETYREEKRQLESEDNGVDACNELGGLILPVPDLTAPAASSTLVISCSLLRSHRAVVRNLEALSPPPTLIFRDYNTTVPAWCTDVADLISPGSSSDKQDENNKCADEEAHIILSPSVGILLTTSQETTQRYLPGHRHGPTAIGIKCDFPLRERISRLCLRYEHLYLLVCHSTPTNPGKFTMDSKTADSVRSLTSFCSSLSPHCLITPLLIPSSANFLTQWIASLSNKHAFSLPSWMQGAWPPGTPLLTPEDPTVWELFLQWAGLNAFAAQMILSLPPNSGAATLAQESSSVVGEEYIQQDIRMGHGTLRNRPQEYLRNFVAMDPHERKRIYAPIIGGRVLSRAEKRLSVVW